MRAKIGVSAAGGVLTASKSQRVVDSDLAAAKQSRIENIWQKDVSQCMICGGRTTTEMIEQTECKTEIDHNEFRCAWRAGHLTCVKIGSRRSTKMAVSTLRKLT